MAKVKSLNGVYNRTKKDGITKTLLTKEQCTEGGQKNNVRNFGLRILRHNVQSLFNKKNEITLMLSVDRMHINVLCLTEHWLSEDQLKVVYIDNFNLVSKYCRTTSLLGGSCIYVNNKIQSKEVSWFNKVGRGKVFEISVIELLEFHTILACIYRSPESDFYDFLNKLEELIVKVYSKGKYSILCGDWNVNFLHMNGKLQYLQNLLLMNNLINVIESPTRITSHSKSLIDVVIINNSK